VSTQTPIPIALPDVSETYSQDQEWCVVRVNGSWREVQFHDYGRIFSVPGLYERLFYDILECASPATVRGLLHEALAGAGGDAGDLRALDLGAGNGIMGEELRDLGVGSVIGVDIIPEAAEAAGRDRPEVYDAYHVVDLTDLPLDVRADLAELRLNCLTCVAALGFADIPPEAFRQAFNLLETGGWVAFNIKEDFLDVSDPSGFAELIARSLGDGTLSQEARLRYRHRLATSGEPLHYVAIVGTKTADMPAI
jgi:SAM-dependent methyltransferase